MVRLFPFLLTLLGVILSYSSVEAADVAISPLAVIQLNGILRATDGAALCLIESNGSFKMLTMGLSGEDVLGRWEFLSSSDKGLIVRVHRAWSMVNQLNRGDDFRTMEVLIEPGILHDSGHPNDDLYSCKFTESGIKAEAEDKEKTFFPPLKITPVPTTILRPANLTYQLSK